MQCMNQLVCKGKPFIEVTRIARSSGRRAPCMILVFAGPKQAAGLAAERNSWFLDDTRSERADSSVNALFCIIVCAFCSDCASQGKQLWVRAGSILT